MNSIEMMKRVELNQTVVPAFNIPYLPMVEPVIRAIIDEDSFALVEVARLEWKKFHAQSLEAVAEEYFKFASIKHTMLHLDHIPVIDEDKQVVNFMPYFERAINVGFQSVMIDGSRLNLEENIAATKKVSNFAQRFGVAVEAELGAVAGHGSQGLDMSYEELFTSRSGFTQSHQAEQFAKESGCNWLSVAVGSVHGAIAENLKQQKKPIARLDIEQIKELKVSTGRMPLVLHGGSSIQQDHILLAIKAGITKINVGTEIRQPYESVLQENGNNTLAQEAVYNRTRWVIHDFLQVSGNSGIVCGLNP